MKIKWIGKYDGKNLPTVDVEVGAKKLPEVTSKSAIILIPIVLLFLKGFFSSRSGNFNFGFFQRLQFFQRLSEKAEILLS